MHWIWTALDLTDKDKVLSLINAVEKADNADTRTTAAEVASYFTHPDQWQSQGAWVGEELIAFGFVRVNAGQDLYDFTISGGVAPQWRNQGVGAELLEQQLMLVDGIAASLGKTTCKVVMYIDAKQQHLAALAQSLGFTQTGGFKQYRHLVTDLPSLPQLNNFVQIRAVKEEDQANIYNAHLALAGDELPSPGLLTSECEQFWHSLNPKWSVVVYDTFGDRPALAGYLLCSHFMGKTENGTDIAEGYIEEIVVLPNWQGQNLERYLIQACAQHLAADGVHYIGLDINLPLDTTSQVFAEIAEDWNFTEVAVVKAVTNKITVNPLF